MNTFIALRRGLVGSLLMCAILGGGNVATASTLTLCVDYRGTLRVETAFLPCTLAEQTLTLNDVSGYEVNSRTISADPSSIGVYGGISCSAGKRVFGGGVSMDSPPLGYAVVSTRPLAPGDFGIANPQGWFGEVLLTDFSLPTAHVDARLWAICA